MYFHCHTIDRDGWQVVAVVGELDLATLPAARTEVVAATRRRTPPKVVLDLTGLSFLDSVGLGVVAGAIKRVRSGHGAIAVAVESDRVRNVFTLTGFDTLLPVVATVDDAIATLTAAAETDSGGSIDVTVAGEAEVGDD